ncbi:MAG: hypothetical protein HY730_01785 [Candidatus Tectomicrobia bacterium]|uniref:Uncharacterized protein n=1 Tax=Tectimicrobiota bacterium TaxID=2528274 RepID=A0A933GKH3_UNCTE|nr:hypothetical protein [Candidatus Tectomicrobia bacterium]
MKTLFIRWFISLFKPVPCSLALIGYGSAIAVKELAVLAPYAPSWYWLLLLTGFCHVSLALYESSHRQTERIKSPHLEELMRLRERIETRIEKIPTQVMRAEIPELVNQIDQEIIPRFRELTLRHHELGRELSAYQNAKPGQIKPSPPVLKELHRVYEKQQEAMKATLQEMADIDGTLTAFIQEGNENQIVLPMTQWKENLGSQWKILQELLEQMK